MASEASSHAELIFLCTVLILTMPLAIQLLETVYAIIHLSIDPQLIGCIYPRSGDFSQGLSKAGMLPCWKALFPRNGYVEDMDNVNQTHTLVDDRESR